MKTIRFSWMAIMAAAFVLSCAKEENAPLTNDNNGDQPGAVTTKTVTISAKLSEAMTKVGFTPTYTGNKPTEMTLTWEDGDKIRVYNHADRTLYSDFTLAPGSVGQQIGSFIGTPISATSYDVEVINGDVSFATQTQPSDGVTSDLKYLASVSDIGDYSSITFTSFSSVLAITVKMPSTEIAANVKSIDIKAYKSDGTTAANIFSTGNTLTVTFGTIGDAGIDGILNFYATLPQGTKDIDAGTQLIVKVNAPGETHSVYTRFVELGSGLSFTENKLNTISINAINSASYANASATGIGTSANPYLIGDKYQMLAVNGLMKAGETKYFKLIDDIDMTGASWTLLNNASTYNKLIDFDGNSKTISNLGGTMFYVFKGSARNFTLDSPTITSGNKKGAFAQFVQGIDNYITNVDVRNVSTYAGSTGPCGGLIGLVNSGASGETSVTIVDCDLTNVVVNSAGGQAGGIIGDVQAKVVLTNCTRTGGTVGSAVNGDYPGNYVGGLIGRATAEVVVSGCNITKNGAEGSVSGVQNVGGLIGYCSSGTISSSVTNIDVSASGPYAGGIAGEVAGAVEFTSCTSRSKITSSSTFVGGFAGRLSGSASCSSCKYLNNTVWSNIGTGNVYVGGFAGYIGSTSEGFTGTITGCLVSNANVSSIKYKEDGKTAESSGKFVGGFAGGVGHSTPSNNTGSIQLNRVHSTSVYGNSYSGGFVGASYAAISKCNVTGGSSYLTRGYGASVGGFAGYQQGNTIEYCYSNINVTATGKSNVGGLVGQAKETTITECYAVGTVSGADASTGGVIGNMNSGSTANRCIRWNDSNVAKVCGSIASGCTTDANCAVKGSSDTNFKTFVTSKGWDTGTTIWDYGNPPSLVGMPN